MPLCLAIAIAIWIPAIASADIVSGRIFGLDEKPILNATFTAKDSKGEATTIKTNKMVTSAFILIRENSR